MQHECMGGVLEREKREYHVENPHVFFTVSGKEELGTVRLHTSPKAWSQKRAELGVKPCMTPNSALIPQCHSAHSRG